MIVGGARRGEASRGGWFALVGTADGLVLFGSLPMGGAWRLAAESADEYGYGHAFPVEGRSDPRLAFDEGQWMSHLRELAGARPGVAPQVQPD